MKSRLFILILICSSHFCLAQEAKTQAEIEAMMKLIKKRADSLLNDPTYKKMVAKGQSMKDSGFVVPSTSASGGSGSGRPLKSFPKRDEARINALQKGTLSAPQLQQYIQKLYTRLATLLPGPAASAKELAQKLGNDPVKMDALAMIGWVNKAPEESLLLITDAAAKATSDGLIVSNAGAILDLVGLPDLAIPILRSAAAYLPTHAIVLNNMGQAFAHLGMLDSASKYLNRCISASSQHPEANSTAGYIQLVRGNKGAAKLLFENSIRGSFNNDAYRGLIYADRESKLAPLVKPKVKFPEYINLLKYKLPAQCTRVENAARAEQEHTQYREMLMEIMAEHTTFRHDLDANYIPKKIETMKKQVMDGDNNTFRPFHVLGILMSAELTNDFMKERLELEQWNKINRKQYKDLEKEYENAFAELLKRYPASCCGEGNTSCCRNGDAYCRDVNQLRNGYLERFAYINTEWQTRMVNLYKKYLDDLIYYSYIYSLSDYEFKGRLYALLDDYLTDLERHCYTKILDQCEPARPPVLPKKDKEYESDLKCWLDVELPFVIGKIELSCLKFAFKAGEGLLFKYEKKFTGKRESTLAIGFGEGIYLSPAVQGVKFGIEAKAEIWLYTTLDNQGHISDAGITGEAKAEFGIKYETSRKWLNWDGNEFVDKISYKIKTKNKTNFGYRLSMNTGLTLEGDEGMLNYLRPKLHDLIGYTPIPVSPTNLPVFTR